MNILTRVKGHRLAFWWIGLAAMVTACVGEIAYHQAAVYASPLVSRICIWAVCALGFLVFFLSVPRNHPAAPLPQSMKHHRIGPTDRRRIESEVARRTASLTQLTHHLQIAREDERKCIARDLHDELGALLTSAKLDATRLKSRLMDTAPATLDLLAHLNDTLNQCVALKRRIIEGLQPSTLPHLGLAATLEILARELTEQTGIQVHCDLTPVQLEATTELVIYRVVQESFTNLTKYAQARHIWLALKPKNGFVQVSVRDDGVGFNTAVQPHSAHGLAGMRFRVEAEGGSFGIESTPGKGTLVKVRLPQSIHCVEAAQKLHSAT